MSSHHVQRSLLFWSTAHRARLASPAAVNETAEPAVFSRDGSVCGVVPVLPLDVSSAELWAHRHRLCVAVRLVRSGTSHGTVWYRLQAPRGSWRAAAAARGGSCRAGGCHRGCSGSARLSTTPFVGCVAHPQPVPARSGNLCGASHAPSDGAVIAPSSDAAAEGGGGRLGGSGAVFTVHALLLSP